MKQKVLSLIVIALLFTACAPLTPPPTPTATALTPTETPTPPPTLTPTPTIIPGPFEGQPAIPYPSDEVVQGLGITAYQVVGEQYVALSKEGYVVAQAITNEKGEFAGWQRTLPFDVETKFVVPHPQETNPELFDTTNPDSPIVQFANAFGVKPEEVGNLTPKLLTGVDGKQFIVLTTGDLAATVNYDESGTPLMIAEQGENGEWGWSGKGILGKISNHLGINSGTLLGGYGFADYYNDLIKIQKDYFNYGMVNTGQMGVFKGPNDFYYRYIDSDVRLGTQNGVPLMSHLLVWPSVVPNWLVQGNYSNEELTSLMNKWITTTMKRYPQIKVWEVVNEAYNKDFFQKRLGDDYILEFYRIAREARPDATLIYNDYANHSLKDKNFPNGQRTSLTLQIIKKLQEEDLIDGVGVQMIIFADMLPSYEDITNTLRNYGIPVYVTEFQVIMTNIPGTREQRWLKQAEIYYKVVEAILKSGNCNTIIYFNQSDKVSPWENEQNLHEYSKNADPTLFDDNYQPKPAYYAVLKALSNYITEFSTVQMI